MDLLLKRYPQLSIRDIVDEEPEVIEMLLTIAAEEARAEEERNRG